jgi:hypothetical protein
MTMTKLSAGTIGRRSNPREKAKSAPLSASAEPVRLVIVPGLETPSGGPVWAMATGHPRRPVLTALVSFAALAAPRAEGGAA